MNNMEERRRTRIDLMAAILEASGSGGKKTRIMYKANVNPRDHSKIMAFLIQKGLLEQVAIDGERNFQITTKGREFVENYYRIVEALQ